MTGALHPGMVPTREVQEYLNSIETSQAGGGTPDPPP